MHSEKQLNQMSVEIIKNAFKRYLFSQIGDIDQKPSIETQAWILALEELALDFRKHLISSNDLSAFALNPMRAEGIKGKNGNTP